MYEENISLIKQAQEGNQAAFDRLINENIGLVRSIALRFRDRGTELDDLIQIGTIGMIKAVRSFDTSYNTAFSTYAVPLIYGEIRRFLRDDGIIKVGRGLKKAGIDAMKKREEFVAGNGREPRLSELAELCGSDTVQIAEALEAISPVHSLSEPGGNGEDGEGCLDGIISDPENGIELMTNRIALREAIGSLGKTERQLIYLRFFKEMSQNKTGEILGMTQVKVSREEKRIIEKLRKQMTV